MQPHDTLMRQCDELLRLTREVRDRYLRQTASTRELLCGVWEREGADLALRIYDSPRHDGYDIDIRCRNALDTRERVYTHILEQDAEGNLYFGPLEFAVAYDERHDRLLTEHFGIFERHKT